MPDSGSLLLSSQKKYCAYSTASGAHTYTHLVRHALKLNRKVKRYTGRVCLSHKETSGRAEPRQLGPQLNPVKPPWTRVTWITQCVCLDSRFHQIILLANRSQDCSVIQCHLAHINIHNVLDPSCILHWRYSAKAHCPSRWSLESCKRRLAAIQLFMSQCAQQVHGYLYCAIYKFCACIAEQPYNECTK